MVKGVNNNGSLPYQINRDGAIELSSIQDRSVFDIAKGCDKDGNQKLETAEINDFLQKYTTNLGETDGYKIYYERKDNNGQLLRRSYSMKADNAQIVYEYKDGKPIACAITTTDNQKFVLNLKTGEGHRYFDVKNKPDKYDTFNINDEMKEKYKKLGNGEFDTSPVVKKPFEDLINTILGWFGF